MVNIIVSITQTTIGPRRAAEAGGDGPGAGPGSGGARRTGVPTGVAFEGFPGESAQELLQHCGVFEIQTKQ